MVLYVSAKERSITRYYSLDSLHCAVIAQMLSTEAKAAAAAGAAVVTEKEGKLPGENGHFPFLA